jgi:hypothetical protein
MSPLFLLGRALESPKYKAFSLLTMAKNWKYNGEDLIVEPLKRREGETLAMNAQEALREIWLLQNQLNNITILKVILLYSHHGHVFITPMQYFS